MEYRRDPAAEGRRELRRALGAARSLFWSAAFFSLFVNVLMLTGPLFMLQVYDRVLTSRSVETLVALFTLVVFLYGVMGVLDHVRSRLLARAGARFQSMLDDRVFQAGLARAIERQERGAPKASAQDVDAVQRLLAGPAPTALFDAPWTPFFLGLIVAFHPWLGALAAAGGALILAMAMLAEAGSRRAATRADRALADADSFGRSAQREAETIRALGMVGAVGARWRRWREEALDANIAASDANGVFAALSKTLRLLLQSAMLGVGAYLVLREEITPGVMIASTIILGRALAPIEQAVAQWPQVQRARLGWTRLRDLLGGRPAEEPRTPLPRPVGALKLSAVSAAPPGGQAPTLRGVSLDLAPGKALGVIGPSGSGKSTLARLIAGVWRPMAGEVRLDGAALDQWAPDALGRLIGYLPQEVGLLDGAVADNIARFDAAKDPVEIVRAARQAGAHEMILGLPAGYDTRIGVGGAQLSGGQRQRIALARAFYGRPALLILDEPNANLDQDGETALTRAVLRALRDGAIVVIIAHRPGAIAVCDQLLMLENGRVADYGARDAVLRRRTANADALLTAAERIRAEAERMVAEEEAAA